MFGFVKSSEKIIKSILTESVIAKGQNSRFETICGKQTHKINEKISSSTFREQ